MFFYQAVIMGLVLGIVLILMYVLKLKNRTILAFSIITLIIIAGVCMYAVQYFFGNHFSSQNINTQDLEQMTFSRGQKGEWHKIFGGYSDLSGEQPTDAIGKVYKLKSGAQTSQIEADVYVFYGEKDADKYFEFSQKFYENKNYIPLDPLKCHKTGNPKYLVSFVKSEYKDVNDFIYLPSKISYTSDAIVQSGNIIVSLTENSNKPVSMKNAVLKDIISRIKANPPAPDLHTTKKK